MIEIIMNGDCKHHDINLVYRDKMMLSEMALEFNAISISNTNIIVDKTVDNNYTGDFTKFYSYKTPKIGLHLGWLRY